MVFNHNQVRRKIVSGTVYDTINRSRIPVDAQNSLNETDAQENGNSRTALIIAARNDKIRL